jgi:putative peptide maturation dehydrogenase
VRVRRTAYVFFFRQDQPLVDISALLRGALSSTSLRQLFALSALAGEEHSIGDEQLDLVLDLPADEWAEVEDGDRDAYLELARKGLIVSDLEDPHLAELRRRDEQLARDRWNVYAALFHFLTRWHGVDLRSDASPDADPLADPPGLTAEMIQELVERHGHPPPAFHSRAAGASQALPIVTRDDGLYELLRRRRTTRRWDRETRMTIEQLSLLLYYVFGCHGYATMFGDDVMLKRTSPSGGGLHPVGTYPLISNVDDVDPGLYHYNVREHSLELLSPLSERDAMLLATDFMCGQTYFGSAHVVFVLAARFYRSYWKYRKHQKAYTAVLMDAAHLSQTLYLVATELGLGAFVTAAINSADVDRRLGLDGYAEGAIAIAGCGVPSDRLSPLDPIFKPYVPRETVLP